MCAKKDAYNRSELVMIGRCIEKKLGIKTGGGRRFFELYSYIKESGSQIDCLGSLRFKDLFRYRDADVCVVFDERYLLFSIVLKIYGCKIVFCPRGNKLEHHCYKYGRIRLYVYRKIFQCLYMACDKGIFQTIAQKNEFVNTYGWDKVSAIVPNNVNASWMKSLKCSDSNDKKNSIRSIGYFGGDNPRKGFSLIIDAYCKAKEKNYTDSLLIGGNVSDEYSLCDGVNCLGWVDNIKDFYASVYLVVIPSLYDSFPNVFLESIAAGVPVIISKNEISMEICCGNEEMLFDGNSDDLADKLLMASRFDEYYMRLKRSVDELFEKYSFDWGKAMLNEILS